MRIYKLIIIYLLHLPLSCFAEPAGSNNLSAVGFYSPVGKIIEKLDNENAGYKEHFLLGTAFKKQGEPKKAILHFANSCFKFSQNTSLKIYPYTIYKYLNGFHFKSDFYDDAVHEIAGLFFEYREYEYVIKFVELMKRSNTALFRDAAILKSNAMMELGRLDNVINHLKELHSKFTDLNSRSIIKIRIASAFEKKEDFANAVREYLAVLKLSPGSWQSGIACNRIIGITSKIQFEFNNDEALLLASSLYYNAKYENSQEVLKELLNRDPDENLRNEAIIYTVKNSIRTGKTGYAESLISQYRNDRSLHHKFLKIEADELWTMKKKQPAYGIYLRLLDDSADDILKDSYKRILQFQVGNNIFDENLITGFKDKYPKDKAAEYFLWAFVKNKIKVKDNGTAVKFMEEALSSRPDGAYSAGYRFWLVKLYGTAKENDNLKLQKIKEMAVLNPDSAYTWKLLDEMKDKYGPEELRNMFAESVRSRKSEDAIFSHAVLYMQEKKLSERNNRIHAMDFIEILKRYKTLEGSFRSPDLESGYKDNLKGIEKYFTIGYTDGINRELAVIPDKDRESRIDKHKMLAYLGTKYNNYYLGASSLIKLLKYCNLRENIFILSEDIIKTLLPDAFYEQVEANAGQGIPKEMVYAVMKAESTFNHKAVSSAGATGLMQLMPATAKDIAGQLKMKDFDLKDPAVSIGLGVKYLAWLNRYFKGDFEAMMAGYNAGAGNVKKWLKDYNGNDDDFLTEFIPFEETRSYILRTRKFFMQYKTVYGIN